MKLLWRRPNSTEYTSNLARVEYQRQRQALKDGHLFRSIRDDPTVSLWYGVAWETFVDGLAQLEERIAKLGGDA